ncbi:sporulation protein [Mammaliicoccus lentus]|uniref:sporulation protein n=1 Tax=Mammaliicoccus lentus TaxID=42858 RepID=UPI001DC8F373|nr:sporulation protein [Mammaliicoccus lentus]MCD2476938.1 sporulation protein [Mammaliicoccus lentus]MCD2520554.1 sporulation protein [Mammaliicoccus lentus]HIS17923.1 sporulation protein [Candidatus Coprovivens excrementavium]HJF22159.1 sporulation protein [Mammaliicoccus lentus]
MFEKLLTSIGIGNLKIDTRLEKLTFNEEEPIKGKVIFYGGSCDIKVEYIMLSLIERVNNKGEDSDFAEFDNVLHKYKVNKSFVIKKGAQQEYEFEFKLEQIDFKGEPEEIFLKTHVHIDQSVGADDEERLIIVR